MQTEALCYAREEGEGKSKAGRDKRAVMVIYKKKQVLRMTGQYLLPIIMDILIHLLAYKWASLSFQDPAKALRFVDSLWQ